MPKGMLGDGVLLNDIIRGPVATLLGQLNGQDGDIVLHELNRFLRHEISWGDVVIPDKDPELLYSHWEVERHIRHGDLKVTIERGIDGTTGRTVLFNGRRIGIRQLPTLRAHDQMTLVELQNALPGTELLNANVCNFFDTRKELIPESWKPTRERFRRINFIGTIFKNVPLSPPAGISVHTQQLQISKGDKGRWGASSRWINTAWGEEDWIAVFEN